MSSFHDMPKPSAGSMEFPASFFGALNRNDADSALDALKREAFRDGTTPSPRAQALIDSGEWDEHQKLSLCLIDEACCRGRIGWRATRAGV